MRGRSLQRRRVRGPAQAQCGEEKARRSGPEPQRIPQHAPALFRAIPARTGSTAIVGTNSAPAYFTPTSASAACSAASKNTGHRKVAVRTTIHAAKASRDRQVAS